MQYPEFNEAIKVLSKKNNKQQKWILGNLEKKVLHD